MLLEGKKALIFGIANQRSIAAGIARAMKDHGARLAIGYASETLKKRIDPISEELGADFTFCCDLTKDQDIKTAVDLVKDKWASFDLLVHSVAFAPSEELQGRFVQTSRQGFHTVLDISTYSLIALCQAFESLMTDSASVITMTYHGSTQVLPNYNVMGVAKAALEASVRYLAADIGPQGIRVNAISAGPIRTLSAAGVTGFRTILNHIQERSPLKRNISQDEVGRTAVYLASDLSSGTTGEVVYADSGYHIMGM